MSRKKAPSPEVPAPVMITPEELAHLEQRRRGETARPAPKAAQWFGLATVLIVAGVVGGLLWGAYRLGFESGVVSGMEEIVTIGAQSQARRSGP